MITVVTAATKSYEWMLTPLIKQVNKLGYPLIVYDLDDLGYGVNFEKTFACSLRGERVKLIQAWKPAIFLNGYYRAKTDRVMWIDSDSLLVQGVDEMDFDDYDVALTVNKEDLNTGVWFMNKNFASEYWLRKIIKSTARFRGKIYPEGEQHTVRIDMARYYPRFPRNQLIDHDGMRLRFVPSKVYNNASPKIINGALDPTIKVIHMPGRGKKDVRWASITQYLP